jgi:hypothetical protein
VNCRRVKRLLPLAAGRDLSSRQGSRLQAHLDRCPVCLKELNLYRKSLSEIKFLARNEVLPDWSESEWREMVRRATSQGQNWKRPFLPEHSRLAWTLGSAFALLLLAASAVLIFRGRNEKNIPPLPATPPAAKLEVNKQVPQPNPEPRLRPPAPGPKIGPRQPPASERKPAHPALQAQAPQKQSVTHMVFVSSESGLTIRWVFNSEFEWKEK